MHSKFITCFCFSEATATGATGGVAVDVVGVRSNIGAPGSTNGTAYVVFGPITADVDLSTSADLTFTGNASGDQLGAALLVLLSAGYAPRTPSTLILTVLAVALLARSSIAFARELGRGATR